MARSGNIVEELQEGIPEVEFVEQSTAGNVPTVWVEKGDHEAVLAHAKEGVEQPYGMLFDLTAIDERERNRRPEPVESDFSVVYELLSLERNADLRVKVPLAGEEPTIPSVTGLWPNANWYEREIWDMFGIEVEGHPNLERLLMPPSWEGHPLRREHPARATDMQPYRSTPSKYAAEHDELIFEPEDWGLQRSSGDTEFMFLNLGPQHPGTHGVIRFVLQLDGEEIVECIPQIGFHHRAAEKMGERQTWHTYIPYTDRVDYLGGVTNNLPYVRSVEQLAGIEVPARAQVIRVMICELYRIASHLVFYGTFAQDVGQMSPVFYMFSDRERILDIIQSICGSRMHPNWFRIGGVAQDLPEGWEPMIQEFLDFFPGQLEKYNDVVLDNQLFKRRTKGVGAYTTEQAIEWGATGPGLRATGLAWDVRKKRTYSAYDRVDFDVPTAQGGDCFDRAAVRVQEMRQSARIIRQCMEMMPDGPVKSDHPMATPPRREQTMEDIETLIDHFLGTTWGPVIPAGEARQLTEGTKGAYAYNLVSDKRTEPYRVRIR
ncbi:MAG: NADH-quinone oxidoreductase subunit C/D, partial [Bradymonadaceae bacterium]